MRYRAIVPAFLVGAVVSLTGCPGDQTYDTPPPATETAPMTTDPAMQPGMTDPAMHPGMTTDTAWVDTPTVGTMDPATGIGTTGTTGAPRP
jgi:hypothetical protein